ncbi:replication protein P [Saccharospirillum mangrovi]|uniref:replication protein P n=1 Tax=Saccharospirillum mangrovi TaxID=2161747 RepID=UPI000D3B5582|nr:replication protein P [Saccharospirillum mangrovi]
MIFARMQLIYTHRFESAYGDEETLTQAKREWAYSLAGVEQARIEYALERCKLELAWPPTIAEFVRYLTPDPQALGLPSTRDAYLEACQNSHAPSQTRWQHPAVQWAARETGYFKLRSEPERHSWPAFESVYRNLIERLADGEEIDFEAQEVALPAPDFSAEDRLIEQLKKAGASDGDAYQLAYYLEKPAGSELRARYRQRSQERLAALQLSVELPD